MANRFQQGQSPANSIIKGQKMRPSLALHRFSVQSFQLSTRGFPSLRIIYAICRFLGDGDITIVESIWLGAYLFCWDIINMTHHRKLVLAGKCTAYILYINSLLEGR